jgi:hypothetical protein
MVQDYCGLFGNADEITVERQGNCSCYCKMLSYRTHVVQRSNDPQSLNAIAQTSQGRWQPVSHPSGSGKKVLKIARFCAAPCIISFIRSESSVLHPLLDVATGSIF